ncbi:hypothetical protein [Tahibacter caeni]|uniref:hypothetical protein n=1 Tax=Tahibacter caeni TaxID=1453545 RepID=UPI00214918E3|nr:hypothetical protein [Tahibacter caeni]
MATYSLHKAQFEMLLVLASRSISELAVDLARESGEAVGVLPTEQQFKRAWKSNQQQVEWVQGLLEEYLGKV